MSIFDLPETQLERRGHVFYGEELKQIPPLYSTEEVQAQDKIVMAKFFGGSATWYVVELDQENGIAFGWADLGIDWPEWGYFSLLELEGLSVANGLIVIERDLDFQPTRFGDIHR